MHRTLMALILCLGTGGCARDGMAPAANASGPVPPGVHRLEELTWPQVDALDRERTLLILPVGMLEVHGPHLPIGTDTIGLVFEAAEASRRVSRALPDWHVVMMPPINYGQSGANELGGQQVHAGTYAIRQSTLRSLVADLGGQVAQNRFKWIFVLNGHGAATHNIAISEACDFVSGSFGVTMLHVTALLRADPGIQAQGQAIDGRHFSADELSSFGMDLHAGVGETSGMLAVRPDLVSPAYKTLPPRVGRSLEEARSVATTAGWQGYLSDPARATAAYGREVEDWWIEGFADLMVRAIRGENMFAHPRFPDSVPPPVAGVAEAGRAFEAAFAARLETWLAQRQTR